MTSILTEPMSKVEIIASMRAQALSMAAAEAEAEDPACDMLAAEQTRLIPRLTNPALAPSEIEALGPADFMSLCTGVVGFFFTEAQIEAETARMN